MALLIAGILLFSLTAFYYLEKRGINRKRTNIKTLIAVTGTRGKSTTVRFLTFLFQKSGFKTLGKVTGTKAALILPDGSFQKINRKGITSIIEQKNVLLKTADKIKPEIVITEIMSVTPEYQKMETQNMLDPDYLVITNVKEDHIGVSGSNKEEIAGMFISSTPEKTICIAPKSEKDHFKTTADRLTFLEEDAKLKQIKEIQPGFSETLVIAGFFVRQFNIKPAVFQQCIGEFERDNEVFYIKERDKNTIYVNAFSANDPESTFRIINDIKCDFPNHIIRGIFCTRKDKPNRTAQWINQLKHTKDIFDSVLVYGSHYNIIRRQIYPFEISRLKKENFESVFSPQNQPTVFLGFGNYVNSGDIILKHWDEVSQ